MTPSMTFDPSGNPRLRSVLSIGVCHIGGTRDPELLTRR